ncbi:acyltransferase [Moritella viscosa]|uniref:acyltransferase n=1 Tax=Moritella viscosa TaxID=80854 RepID=UPI000508FE6D|nr:acyltransferase [Moritella viscosa]CED60802.1 acyltransferase [Moritella viscosa]
MSFIRGCLAFTFWVINLLFWATPIIILSPIKLLPIKNIQSICSSLLVCCASSWIRVNVIIERLIHPVNIHLHSKGIELSEKEWYMVLANHQSWVDILILQRVLNKKIPFLKFFLKKELIFVPFLGIAWWALDFPFMRRYSTTQLKKNPKLRGKDIEVTRKACAKFKSSPVSVMNFVEGTRLTTEKHNKQNSPFKHLLKPKAGGLAFALSALGDHIHKIVDVAIYYPGQTPTFWQYLCGEVKNVHVHIRVSDIDDKMRGDYQKDRAFKIGFQQHLNQLWIEKDAILETMAQSDSTITDKNKAVEINTTS